MNRFAVLFIALIAISAAGASYAVFRSLAGEVGTNDFRISAMGTDGDNSRNAENAAVAFNSEADQYLVVWRADDDVNAEFEIYGQIVSGTGALVGSRFQISEMGTPGNVFYAAKTPKVAYNSSNNQYLVVWEADDNTPLYINEEFEIYGQRVDADGTLLGSRIKISDMGPAGNASYDAEFPDVAYNSRDNEYMVVWHGHDNTAPLVLNEFEIFGQRVSAAGVLTGSRIRLSFIATNGDTNYSAYFPTLAYNQNANQYLVAFLANGDEPGKAASKTEAYGQVFEADGTLVGSHVRLSQTGSDASALLGADYVGACFNSRANEYLVVWTADYGGVWQDEEVFGQRVTSAGVQTGTDDFRISDMHVDGNTTGDAESPRVIYSAASNRYLVVWKGTDNNSPTPTTDVTQIFGQLLASDGSEEGDNDFFLTNFFSSAEIPGAAYNSTSNEVLVVAGGDSEELASSEMEIYGQRFSMPAVSGSSVDNVRVYPNPFRPSQGHATITLIDIPPSATVKIYTPKGRLIQTLTATAAGQAQWDGKNDAGDNAASGVYYALIEGSGGTNTTKIAVQR